MVEPCMLSLSSMRTSLFLRIAGWVDTHSTRPCSQSFQLFNQQPNVYLLHRSAGKHDSGRVKKQNVWRDPRKGLILKVSVKAGGTNRGGDFSQRLEGKPKQTKANQRRHCGSKTWYRATLLGSLCKSSIKQKEDVTRFKGKSMKTELDTKQ